MQYETTKYTESKKNALPVPAKNSAGKTSGLQLQDNRRNVIVQKKSRSDKSDQVVQRVIKKRADGETGEWKYYSDRDPEETLYDTEEEAKAAEDKLLGTSAALPHPQFNADNRPPTFFTYSHVHPTNKVGSNPQGPHVVAYGAVDAALEKSRLRIQTIFSDQVRPPDQVEASIETAVGKLGANKTVRAKIVRFLYDYKQTYRHVIQLIKANRHKEALQYIKWLINTDPVSSTNWLAKLRTQGYSVPKKKIKHKGETSNLEDEVNVDLVSGGPGAKSLYATRKKLLGKPEEDKEKNKEEDKEQDKPGKGVKRKPEAPKIPVENKEKSGKGSDDEDNFAPKKPAKKKKKKVILDVVKVNGVKYAVNDPRIANMGQCLWDTLRHHGISNATLNQAAQDTGQVVDAAVFRDNVWPLIQRINHIDGTNFGLIIDQFNLLTGASMLQIKQGGNDNVFRIGFAVHPETGLGHFIPPLE